MMTLKKIASLFIEQQSGGDASKDSQLSYQVIVLRIRHLLNDFIKPLILERYNDDDRSSPSNFIVNYEFTIQNDALGAYVDLTEHYIALPYNKGVYRVIHRIPSGTMLGQYVDTECTPTLQASINRNTRAGRYPTHKKYYVEGQRIRFQNIYAEPGATNKAIVQQIVAAPDTYGENDALPLSPDMISSVLQKLLTFTYIAPQDKLNNQQSLSTPV